MLTHAVFDHNITTSDESGKFTFLSAGFDVFKSAIALATDERCNRASLSPQTRAGRCGGRSGFRGAVCERGRELTPPASGAIPKRCSPIDPDNEAVRFVAALLAGSDALQFRSAPPLAPLRVARQPQLRAKHRRPPTSMKARFTDGFLAAAFFANRSPPAACTTSLRRAPAACWPVRFTRRSRACPFSWWPASASRHWSPRSPRARACRPARSACSAVGGPLVPLAAPLRVPAQGVWNRRRPADGRRRRAGGHRGGGRLPGPARRAGLDGRVCLGPLRRLDQRRRRRPALLRHVQHKLPDVSSSACPT